MADGAARRDLRPALASVALLGVLAVHALCDPRPPTGAWGAVGVLAFSGWVRWGLLILAGLLALPPASRRVIRAAAPVLQRLRAALGGVPGWAWVALLVAVGWMLRSRSLTGDGAATIDLLQNGELINFKEPLDRLVSALVYRAGYALTGWDAGTAIALVSTLAGALYWSAVLRLARSRPVVGSGGWVVWALLGTTGATQLFFGHVENYSLLTAGTLWTLVLALDAAYDPTRPIWPPALAFGLTFAVHLSAAWLAPALIALWWVRAVPGGGGTLVPGRPGWGAAARDAAMGVAVSSAPIFLVAAGMAAAGLGLSGFSVATFGGGDGRLFVPLFTISTPFERFTMFSAAHFAAFGNELLLVAPIGVILALVGPLGTRRGGRRADPGTWLLVAAAAGTVAYAFTFNPDLMVADPALGVFNEWDLFAYEAVPITLLGLWWLRTAFEPGETRDALVLSVAVTSFVHTAGFLLLNAGIRI
jgi:hypothetical protein